MSYLEHDPNTGAALVWGVFRCVGRCGRTFEAGCPEGSEPGDGPQCCSEVAARIAAVDDEAGFLRARVDALELTLQARTSELLTAQREVAMLRRQAREDEAKYCRAIEAAELLREALATWRGLAVDLAQELSWLCWRWEYCPVCMNEPDADCACLSGRVVCPVFGEGDR